MFHSGLQSTPERFFFLFFCKMVLSIVLSVPMLGKPLQQGTNGEKKNQHQSM